MEIDLDLRVKLFNEYLSNGGIENLNFLPLVEQLMEVKKLPNGKVDPKTISPLVNATMLAYEAEQLKEPYMSDTHISQYQTLLQKSIFFNQTNIDTEEDFDAIFNLYDGKNDILFRGLNEAKYRLYSSLQRHWIENKMYESNQPYADFLKELIQKVENTHNGLLTKYFESGIFNSNNDISVLSFLQHYGCPTPLLDWTYNFKMALYFATENITKPTITREIDDYCCVYLLEEKHIVGSSLKEITIEGLKKNQGGFKDKIFADLRKKDISEALLKKVYSDEVIENMFIGMLGQETMSFMSSIDRLMISPVLYFSDVKDNHRIKYCLNNNLNIVMQEGVFTWVSHPTKPLEHVANVQFKEMHTETNYRFSKCINIHKKLTPYIKGKLNELGIIKEFVFPDPYTFVKSAFRETTNTRAER